MTNKKKYFTITQAIIIFLLLVIIGIIIYKKVMPKKEEAKPNQNSSTTEEKAKFQPFADEQEAIESVKEVAKKPDSEVKVSEDTEDYWIMDVIENNEVVKSYYVYKKVAVINEKTDDTVTTTVEN